MLGPKNAKILIFFFEEMVHNNNLAKSSQLNKLKAKFSSTISICPCPISICQNQSKNRFKPDFGCLQRQCSHDTKINCCTQVSIERFGSLRVATTDEFVKLRAPVETRDLSSFLRRCYS